MEKNRDFDIGWESNVICKMLRIMRVFICIFVLGLSTVSANTFSQVRLSIDVKDATLKEIFKEITKITGYEFVYSNNEVEQVGKVTMNAKDKDLQEVLAECLKGTQLWYMIEDQIVVTVAYNAGSFQNLPGSHAFAEGVVRQQGTPVVCGADKAAFRQILCHFVPPDEFFL